MLRRPAPCMISIPVSPYCELARWTLDRLSIPYVEQGHIPVLHLLATLTHGGGNDVPVIRIEEQSLRNARDVITYYDSFSPDDRRLFPIDSVVRAETERLFDLFYDTLGKATRSWAYAYLLPARDTTVRTWMAGVGPLESLVAQMGYPVLAAAVRRTLGIGPNTIPAQRAVIDAVLDQVEQLLVDGRRFLQGDHFTAADLALAALSAPLILPTQYGGPLPALDELPPALQHDIAQLRARPAGRFILRLYHDERPRSAMNTNSAGRLARIPSWRDALTTAVTRPNVLRPVSLLLRAFAPILRIRKLAVVSRYPDVVDALARDSEFTIEAVNKQRLERIDGPFILGMDRSARYEREDAVLRSIVPPGDMQRIQAFVARTAAEMIEQVRSAGQIDVVGEFARIVPARLVATYFGVAGPDEPTLLRWMRDLFHEGFLNLPNDLRVREVALRAAQELQEFVDAEIARRKSIEDGEQADDVLGRLIRLQATTPWLDDESIRRNIDGVIVGAIDTTASFVAHVMDELMDRPTELERARTAALAGDIDLVRRYAYEAARFNPFSPLMLRYCAQDTMLGAGLRARRIPAGTFVLLSTLSAMHDYAGFSQPGIFKVDRPDKYLHFGYGLHQCFGTAINGVQIPELVAALLRLPNLRRAPGGDGQVVYDGPFPDQFMLQFDPVARS